MVWRHSCRILNFLQQDLDYSCKTRELLSEHAEWSTVCSIYFSNLLEDKGMSLSDTTQLVMNVLAGKPSVCDDVASCEVLQHAAAFTFLRDEVVVNKKPLTPELASEAHRMLMAGMVREDGLVVRAGSYRDSLVNAGFYLFPPPGCIEAAVKDLLEAYNTRAASGKEDPFVLAAWLSMEYVSIHPFEDGNGRMCRLLLSIALLSNGVPFCSALGFSSGHRRAKSHYMQCIKNARSQHGDMAQRLAFVVLCSFRDCAVAFLMALSISAPELKLPMDAHGRP